MLAFWLLNSRVLPSFFSFSFQRLHPLELLLNSNISHHPLQIHLPSGISRGRDCLCHLCSWLLLVCLVHSWYLVTLCWKKPGVCSEEQRGMNIPDKKNNCTHICYPTSVTISSGWVVLPLGLSQASFSESIAGGAGTTCLLPFKMCCKHTPKVKPSQDFCGDFAWRGLICSWPPGTKCSCAQTEWIRGTVFLGFREAMDIMTKGFMYHWAWVSSKVSWEFPSWRSG